MCTHHLHNIASNSTHHEYDHLIIDDLKPYLDQVEFFIEQLDWIINRRKLDSLTEIIHTAASPIFFEPLYRDKVELDDPELERKIEILFESAEHDWQKNYYRDCINFFVTYNLNNYGEFRNRVCTI